MCQLMDKWISVEGTVQQKKERIWWVLSTYVVKEVMWTLLRRIGSYISTENWASLQRGQRFQKDFKN